MTDERNDTRRLWIGPAAVWIALLVLLAASCGSAYLPLGASNVALNLGIAAAMVGVLVTFLMDLRHSAMLLRIVAAAGVFWTLFLFALTFCDYLTRHY